MSEQRSPLTSFTVDQNTPQPGDINPTLLRIGDRVRVYSAGHPAVITRIHGYLLWVTFEDGTKTCVSVQDAFYDDPMDDTQPYSARNQ
jgi:hypothetical protein